VRSTSLTRQLPHCAYFTFKTRICLLSEHYSKNPSWEKNIVIDSLKRYSSSHKLHTRSSRISSRLISSHQSKSLIQPPNTYNNRQLPPTTNTDNTKPPDQPLHTTPLAHVQFRFLLRRQNGHRHHQYYQSIPYLHQYFHWLRYPS